MIEVKSYHSPSVSDPLSNKYTVVTTVTDMVDNATLHGIVQEIVRLTAERYVQENYPELISKLDQQAIANLVIAESGKKIAEEIRLTPPPPRVERETKVYQRGILGGLTRIK